MIRLPAEITHMIGIIEDAGFEAYAVGGCVRDTILGRHPEDWDLTSNASRAALEALFPDAAIVNRKLGVMRITEGEVTADIAAYRIDGEYKDYRRPETVIFTEEIDEDLKRRDFTMNAIAVSPGRGVADPFGGRADIARKLIRGIGDPGLRFEEDALRILRAVRFAAQLDFEIDGETLRAMKERAELLHHISA
ncbi:MAG: polynucleotide adenylyltransferase, partial [Eubacteriales bacterium]|nr:polynucleotide adenylyltransferase [Eubacteriales bacterium]